MNSLRKRRGVSGIISGVFLVTVAMMLFGALYWQYAQQDHYNQVTLNRLQREWERLNERLLIDTVETGAATLRFNITNYGSVLAHVTDLYLTNLSATPQWRWRYSLNTWVNPGTTLHIDTGIGLISGAAYRFMVATERGNTFAPATSMVNQPQPLGSQPVPFSLSFLSDAFEFIVEGESGYSTWESRQSAWYIAGNYQSNAILFRLNITNNYDRNVVLLSDSNMLLVCPELSSDTMKYGYKMYVAKENTVITGKKQQATIQAFPSGGQTIPARSSCYVYFGATLQRGIIPIQLSSSGEDRNYSNYVSMFYQVDGVGTIYGATVAIIAMQIKTT
jgi:hypothetical protein